VSTQGYTYSGSNDLNAVGWYWDNSSDGTKAVGQKLANELGVHDMSGNVWEWVETYMTDNYNRRLRGGSWDNTKQECPVVARFNYHDPNVRYSDTGFRPARSLGN
jgi:formylglycine-generating enzyme required for sulfatase activity